MKGAIVFIKTKLENAIGKAKEFVCGLKDKRNRKALGIKLFVIALVALAVELYNAFYFTFSWWERPFMAIAFFGCIMTLPLLLPGVRPADSLDRVDNNPLYSAISLFWSYPVALIVAKIIIVTVGTTPPLIMTLVAFASKIVINGAIKGFVVEANEKYLHTNA